MKKVLCEIDYFCKVVLEPNERTGVFNTMRFIFAELIKRKDLDITFVSYQYPICFFKKRFVKDYPEFRNAKSFWLGSFRDKVKYFFQSKAYEYRQNYKKDKKVGWKILYTFFKIFRGLAKLTPDIKYFANKKISNYDFYLSLSKPIPKIINQNKNIKKGIFIHDLIPIKHPEFFEIKNKKSVQKTLKKFGEIFDSIKKDTIIYCNSKYTKKDLLEVYPKFKNNKIVITYLGVDKNKYFYLSDRDKKNSKDFKNIQKSLEKYKIPKDKPYFLSLTSMNPRKNTAFIVRGFVKFLKKNPKVSINLVLAGKFDWNCDDIFKEIKRDKSFKDRIIVTGYVDDKDVNNVYNRAFGFVYPSLYEGFGMPALEAMQCGVPVITSNTTSIPEVVGNAGILINPNKDDELIKAFEKLYEDKKFRDELLKKSLKRAKKFSWGKTVKKIILGFNK
jgi:glycosyltransferase involved in cell wall biosynthesis